MPTGKYPRSPEHRAKLSASLRRPEVRAVLVAKAKAREARRREAALRRALASGLRMVEEARRMAACPR